MILIIQKLICENKNVYSHVCAQGASEILNYFFFMLVTPLFA